MIKIQQYTESGMVSIGVEGTATGRIFYTAQHNGESLSSFKISIAADDTIKAECDSLKIEDRLCSRSGYIVIRRRWTAVKTGKWQFGFTFVPEKQDYTDLIIPSLMYHENCHGEGKFPRGGIEAGWSFREDRMPIPSCAIVHDNSRYCLLFTEPAKDDSDISSIRVFNWRKGTTFEIAIPFIEAPFSYCEKGILLGGLRKSRKRYFTLIKSNLPFIYERTFYLKADEFKGNVFRIFPSLTSFACMEFSKEEKERPADWGTIASLKLHHLLYLTVDDRRHDIAGIQQGKGNPWMVQHAHENIAGSFLAKSLEGAFIYAKAGIELNNSEFVNLAERIGRFFLKGAMENGLHQDFYKYSEKRMSGFHLPFDATTEEMREGANARCNGETMVNYLRLYSSLIKIGREIPEFKRIAERNARFYIDHQLADDQVGSFGRWWNKDGKPISTNGTNGAHIISVLVELEKIAGKSTAIEHALTLAADYYGALIHRNEYYGDTLDADCVDKEAGVVLLRAFLDLYEHNGDKKYLVLACDAASFVLSWMWTYNVPFKRNTALGKSRFKTRGMTAVSVALQHIDFYGLFPAYDFLRLWQATGEEKWKEFALLLINCCSQLISSADNMLGRSQEFIGWQPEHIYQTDWNYFLLEFGGKGTWDTCIGWEVVLTLGALLDIRARFPETMNFSFDIDLLKQLGSLRK